MMSKFQILDRSVGLGQAPYFIAQLDHSCVRDASSALTALDAAADAGAEAVELHAPAMLDGDIVKSITKRAASLDVAVIATHYTEADLRSPLALSATAQALAYPILIHQGLVSQAAATKRPLLVSTEACELSEIEAAYAAARSVGGQHMAILHHVGGEAGAPANLHTILDMSFRFDTVIGLTDRSQGATVSIAAVALGASIVAKPFALDQEGMPKGALTAPEFAEMTAAGRRAWQSLGLITYGLSDAEKATRAQRAGDGQLLAG